MTYAPLRSGRPPQANDVEGDFARYARDRWPRLVATARLLTEDAGAAEELARRTLVRVCARWRRVPRNDVDFHVRRSLVRAYLRGRRAGGRRRVVLVLRHWEGLGEAEIAQLLGCSVGAVRAWVRRGEKETRAEDRRAGFAAVLAGLVPPAVPLDDIQRDGVLRRRRRAGAVAAGCALLLAPPALLAAGPLAGGGATPASEAPDRPAPGPVRIVAPGERVSVAPGVDLWLTPDGRHWSSPQAPNRFLPVDDVNLDRTRAGVSVQGEDLGGGTYLRSGMYYGLTADPARIEIRAGGRTVTANVLTLAGSPGWGVWYAKTPLADTGTDTGTDTITGAAADRARTATGARPAGSGQTVTVYDAAGEVLVRSAVGPPAARPVPVGMWRS
ncbi:sigma factor-like helix-turn-helix DNA-binding protein [Streptomyces sp. NPDC016626]|uniref:sigma factor-like helix-turn-helix DNA-binding protein n=1 Tax=Streptomyces sp. NPDC016626 TaxID=3364968 RepID=UPI0036F9FEC2